MANTDNNKSVREFYDKFKQSEHVPAAHEPASLKAPTISEERLHLKLNLIKEEFIELVEAVYGKASGAILKEAWAKAQAADEGNRDIVEAADATADLRYVIEGFDIETNIPSHAIFAEVHLSNLSKLDREGNPILSDGTDGKPFGKILKGEDFFEPDLRAILDGRTPDRTPKAQKEG